jgi:hypothetical protein
MISKSRNGLDLSSRRPELPNSNAAADTCHACSFYTCTSCSRWAAQLNGMCSCRREQRGTGNTPSLFPSLLAPPAMSLAQLPRSSSSFPCLGRRPTSLPLLIPACTLSRILPNLLDHLLIALHPHTVLCHTWTVSIHSLSATLDNPLHTHTRNYPSHHGGRIPHSGQAAQGPVP